MTKHPPEPRGGLTDHEKQRLACLIERVIASECADLSLDAGERSEAAEILRKLRTGPPAPRNEAAGKRLRAVVSVLFVVSILLVLAIPPAIVATLTGSATLTSIAAVACTFGLVVLTGGLMGKVQWGAAIIALVVLLALYGAATLVYAGG
jgi:hypothetical protein